MNSNLILGNVKSAMKIAGAGSSDLWFAPINQIHVMEDFNVRVHDADYDSHIRTLVDSIKVNGFLRSKPLEVVIVREGEHNVIKVTDGHSRLAAAKIAREEGVEIETLPLVTRPSGTSMEDLVVGLVTSNTGRPLQPLELSAVCKRLVNLGMPEPEIAKRLGFSPQYVARLLALAAAPRTLHSLIAKGTVSATLAMETLRETGGDGAKAVERLSKAVEKSQKKGKVTRAAVVPRTVKIKGVLEASRAGVGAGTPYTLTVRAVVPDGVELALGSQVVVVIDLE